jgi:choline dehydrogenase-like flavoprotein
LAAFDYDVIVVGSGIGGSRWAVDNILADDQGKPLAFGVEGSATA